MEDPRLADPCVVGWSCLAYSIDNHAHAGPHYNCDDCRFCAPGNPPIPEPQTVPCRVAPDFVDAGRWIVLFSPDTADYDRLTIFEVKPILASSCTQQSFCNGWDVDWTPAVPYWFCIPEDYFGWCG